MKFDRDIFFKRYHSTFGKLQQSQVNGLNQMLEFAENDPNFSSIRQLAYAFATVQRETNVSERRDGKRVPMTFNPIHEQGPRSYFNKYEGRANLGNNKDGDGFSYRGRGYVQITGRRNYTVFERLLGANLVSEPDQALTPRVAWNILSIGMRDGIFIPGETLDKYIPKNDRGTADYFNARKIINRGEVRKNPAVVREMARNAIHWEALLRAALIAEDAAHASQPEPVQPSPEPIGEEISESPFDLVSLLFNGLYFPDNGATAEARGFIGGDAQGVYVCVFKKDERVKIELDFEADSESADTGTETAAGFSVNNKDFETVDFGQESNDGKSWNGVIPESGIYLISVTAHPSANYTLKVTRE